MPEENFNLHPFFNAPRACPQSARRRQKALIFENRSGAYVVICEQRIAENRRFLTSIVEMRTCPIVRTHVGDTLRGFAFGYGVGISSPATRISAIQHFLLFPAAIANASLFQSVQNRDEYTRALQAFALGSFVGFIMARTISLTIQFLPQQEGQAVRAFRP